MKHSILFFTVVGMLFAWNSNSAPSCLGDETRNDRAVAGALADGWGSGPKWGDGAASGARMRIAGDWSTGPRMPEDRGLV